MSGTKRTKISCPSFRMMTLTLTLDPYPWPLPLTLTLDPYPRPLPSTLTLDPYPRPLPLTLDPRFSNAGDESSNGFWMDTAQKLFNCEVLKMHFRSPDWIKGNTSKWHFLFPTRIKQVKLYLLLIFFFCKSFLAPCSMSDAAFIAFYATYMSKSYFLNHWQHNNVSLFLQSSHASSSSCGVLRFRVVGCFVFDLSASFSTSGASFST